MTGFGGCYSAYMIKQSEHAQVNSSHTVFFIVAAIGVSLLLATQLEELKQLHWLALVGFALLVYAVWDLIKQLYSFEQAAILYLIIFGVLPFLMSWTFEFPYALTGALVFTGAYALAAAAELLYESVIKRRLPRTVMSHLLTADRYVDNRMTKFHANHFILTEYQGVVMAVFLIGLYFAGVFLLLPH
jgi:hypothetical protein